MRSSSRSARGGRECQRRPDAPSTAGNAPGREDAPERAFSARAAFLARRTSTTEDSQSRPAYSMSSYPPSAIFLTFLFFSLPKNAFWGRAQEQKVQADVLLPQRGCAARSRSGFGAATGRARRRQHETPPWPQEDRRRSEAAGQRLFRPSSLLNSHNNRRATQSFPVRRRLALVAAPTRPSRTAPPPPLPPPPPPPPLNSRKNGLHRLRAGPRRPLRAAQPGRRRGRRRRGRQRGKRDANVEIVGEDSLTKRAVHEEAAAKSRERIQR